MADIKKKILLLSTGDVNGAYEYVYKLAFLLNKQGHKVVMLVKNKTKPDDFVIQYQRLYKFQNKKGLLVRVFLKIKNRLLPVKKNQIFFDDKYYFFSADEKSVNISAEQVIKQIGFIPEFVFSGMTSDYMNSTDLLSLQQLTKSQIYNITVDMNHFTGGCHFAWDCNGYVNGCHVNCPAIISKEGKELAEINFETKFKNAKSGNFKIITGSDWTLQQAKKSKIYKNQSSILNVNSLIDTKILNNKSRAYAKDIFNMDVNKFYILMGCQYTTDKRKGFDYLLEALQILDNKISTEQKERIEVIIVSHLVLKSFNDIPFQKKHLDYIKDYRLLSLLYQATDVFVNSSIEDSGPMMVSEALACGTPVVGFDMGIVNNMVINDYNGYKAKLKDSTDLANGIKTILELSKQEYNQYSLNAVTQVEEFSSFEYADKVLSEILNSESSD
jgi:glycosyltransferase involved in cell wall biosynthesis